MELKHYQQNALEALRGYCRLYREDADEKRAFEEISKKEYISIKEYEKPYICIRIPTGGGKTLLASHAIGVINKEYLQSSSVIVFWIAPSDAIVKQTLEALKMRRHPYREAIEKSFPDRTLEVFGIDEAYRKSFDLSSDIVVIVATMQTFRVEDEKNRKFFEQSGAHQEIMQSFNESPSMANVLKKAHPIVIVDEAHNARSELSLNRIIELEPSFILELTATPNLVHNEAGGKYASNVLYSVSAGELKAENMIKLPIIADIADNWQVCVKNAIEKQAELENIARAEEMESGEYIRPLVLFKAESKRGENPINWERLLEHILDSYQIDRSEIAVHTGDNKELDGINIKDKNCKIKYIITVDALKEGWDAPFAYILCSVADINSATAVEQFLGRVLRLPNACEKYHKELEHGYVFVNSNNFARVMQNLRDNLVSMGFDKFEAKTNVIKNPNSNPDAEIGGLFRSDRKSEKIESIRLDELPQEIKEHINYNHETNEISVVKPIREEKKAEFLKKIERALENKNDIEKIKTLLEDDAPNNFSKEFRIPKLSIMYDGDLMDFCEDVVLENVELSEQEIIQNAKLDESEFKVITHIQRIGIDIDEKHRLKIQKLENQKQDLFAFTEGKLKLTPQFLTKRVVERMDFNALSNIESKKMSAFAGLCIEHLLGDRKFDLITLNSNIYYLAEVLTEKLLKIQNSKTKKQFSLFLDGDELKTSFENSFSFDKERYPAKEDARSGGFNKHYYKIVDKLNDEEFNCASYIDGLEEVEFWVRNVEGYPEHSFWLPTSTDRFYPDFLVMLKKGKLLAIEYKGSQFRGSDDTREKEKIGNVWAGLNGAKVGFAMVFRDDYKDKISNLLS